MDLPDCTEAIYNYWNDITEEERMDLLPAMCDVIDAAEKMRHESTLMQSKYHREQFSKMRSRFYIESDALIRRCEAIWGEDGP